MWQNAALSISFEHTCDIVSGGVVCDTVQDVTAVVRAIAKDPSAKVLGQYREFSDHFVCEHYGLIVSSPYLNGTNVCQYLNATMCV